MGWPPRLRPGTSPQTLQSPPRGGHPVLRLSSGQNANLGSFPWQFPSFPTSCPFRVLLIRVPRPATNYRRFWIWRSSSERQRDFNPPDLGAAQHTLWAHLTSPWRPRRPYRRRRSPTVPTRRNGKPQGSPGSRAWSFQTCSGSSTPPCHDLACRSVMPRIAFPQTPQGRHTKVVISELHSRPACTSCRCYTHHVAVISVPLKVEMTG